MQDGAPIIIKKVRKGGHGHHGGAWKIALADFMTAMFAFFLVMWLVGLSAEDKAMIQAYFNDPIGFSKNPPKLSVNILKPGGPRKSKEGEAGSTLQKLRDADNMQKMEDEVSKKISSDPQLEKMMKAGKIELRVTNEGLVVEFVENEENGEVFFELGSATVRPAAKDVIGKVARILGALQRPVKIQGHTDSRPFSGGGLDNYDLSGQRANAVRRIMFGSGLAQKQVLAVEALAATQPRKPEDPTHFSNRRVTVLLPYEQNTAEIKNLPTSGFAEDREAHFLMPKDAVIMPKDAALQSARPNLKRNPAQEAEKEDSQKSVWH